MASLGKKPKGGGPIPADFAGLVFPDGVSPNRVALGPWRNEKTFWINLVEKRRLVHFGYPLGIDDLRDALSLGPLVFAGRRGPTTYRAIPFIESRTTTYLTGASIRRIFFDVSGMRKMTGEIGDGYFAFFELDLILRHEKLLPRTLFYEKGKKLQLPGRIRVEYLRSLFEV